MKYLSDVDCYLGVRQVGNVLRVIILDLIDICVIVIDWSE